MGVAAAIRARLAGDATLTGLLTQYQGQPALFTAEVPGDAVAPYGLIDPAAVDEPDDAKNADGRDVIHTVRFFAPAAGSVIPIDTIAERARTLLHRQPVGLAAGAFVATCSGPRLAPSDPDLYGRLLSVRIRSLVTP